jgi:hypothetical protein
MSKELRKPQFFHFRTQGANGQIGPKGGATVCYLPIGDRGVILDNKNGEEPTFGKAVIGISVCSLDDPFNKMKGRGRSISDALSRKKMVDLLSMEDFVYIAENLVKDGIISLITKKREKYLKKIEKIKGIGKSRTKV